MGLSPDSSWSPLNPAIYNASVTFGVAKAREDAFIKTFNNSLDKIFKEMQGKYGNAITDEQYAKIKNMKDDFVDVIGTIGQFYQNRQHNAQNGRCEF